MAVHEAVREMRARYDGWSAKPNSADLKAFAATFGPVPPEVMELYTDHDGAPALPRRGDAWLPARPLPIREAIETQKFLAGFTTEVAEVGRLAWLWSDDNSNYLGIYTTGRLAGWLIKLNHEEPVLTPAYRSVGGFLSRLLSCAPGTAPEDREAFDLVMVPRDVPVTVDDPQHLSTDREHAQAFMEMYRRETDPDRRRLWAMSSICLTPVADTRDIAAFLRDDDMWTPAAAIVLMELRRFGGALEEVERLAREGCPNGDSAAMRLLARLGSRDSRAAIARLQAQLTGAKLGRLEQWIRLQNRLQPPSWD